jgi:putative tryptophan/tyrosine transport system substrate-binding protein
MDRRTFTAIVGGSIFAGTLDGDAQQAPKIARIGYLSPSTPAAVAQNLAAFRRGLRDLGHVEGATYVLELRYAEARPERLPDLARELVSLKVDVIVTATDVAIAAVKHETQMIPIVMANSGDPVRSGFITSLARPGGNVTGLSNISLELIGKRLQLLKETVGGLSRVAFLWNPGIHGDTFQYKEAEGVARALGLLLQPVEVARPDDLDRAFSAITEQRAQALVVAGPSPVTFSNRAKLASFAQKNRLPSIYDGRVFVDAGGLMFYGPNDPDMFRRAAIYVDKIVKGAKPADLPVEQPTKFELVINLKTAKALGITIPQSLLVRADEIIQ